MDLILLERFTRLSLVRAAFWGIMGISLLLMPEFLLGGVFYVLTGYCLVIAVLRIALFVREIIAKQLHYFSYFSLVIAILFLIAAFHFIYFRNLLNGLTPVFLGGLLMLEGILYFLIAICAATTLQRFLLIVLSGAVLFGSAAIIVFTFGFGVGGVLGITIVSGIAFLLAFLFELTALCICRKNHVNRFDQEDVR